MLVLVMTNPLEIVLNSLQDGFALAWAKLRGQPFEWIVVMFSVITGAARRDDVRGNSTRAVLVGQWNKMIHRYFVPSEQTGRIAAVGALTFPVRQASYPVFCKKTIGQRTFSGKSPLDSCASLFWVPLSIFASIIWVFLAATSGFSFHFIRVIVVITPPVGFRLIAFIVFISRALSTCGAFGINSAGIHSFLTMALSALPGQIIRISGINLKRFPRQPLKAFGALTKGEWDIEHNNILSLSPSFGMGAELGNSVVRRVIKPPQAHEYCTIESGVLIWH